MKILVSGTSGLIGKALLRLLSLKEHTIFRLVRSRNMTGDNALYWNPEQNIAEFTDDMVFDAVIHLAGENVASRKWTVGVRKRIYESRIKGTKLLCDALRRLPQPPSVFLCASAIGCYGSCGDKRITESSPLGDGFLAKVCSDWEIAAEGAADFTVRVLRLRFGTVLSVKSGALAKMLPPFRFGLGGKLGSGAQYMSWISLDDTVSAIEHCLLADSLSGAVNIVSPQAVTNVEFARTLGWALMRPTFIPVPAFALRLMFGEMADELLLSSARVKPEKLLESGFCFQHPVLEPTLREILAEKK